MTTIGDLAKKRKWFYRGEGAAAVLIGVAATFILTAPYLWEKPIPPIPPPPPSSEEVVAHQPPRASMVVVGGREFGGFALVEVPPGYAVEFETAVPLSLAVKQRGEEDGRFIQLPGGTLYSVGGGNPQFGLAVTSVKLPGRKGAVRARFEDLFAARRGEIRVARVSGIEFDTSKDNRVALWAAREAAVWVTYRPQLPPRIAQLK